MKQLSIRMTKTETIVGWIYFFLQLLLLPTLIVLVNAFLTHPLTEVELNFVYFFLNFALVTIIFRKYLIGCGKIALQKPLRCLSAAGIGLALYWGLSIIVSSVIYFIDPEFMNVNDATIGTMAGDNFGLTAFGVILLVPITEETLFRGLMFQGLHHKNRFLAYAVSALVFALPHVIGYIGYYPPQLLLLCSLLYLPAGIALAWAYERSDSIFAPTLMHMVINSIGVLAMR